MENNQDKFAKDGNKLQGNAIMAIPIPSDLYVEYLGVKEVLNRPYRLFDLKQVIDDVFTYYQQMENDKKAVEAMKVNPEESANKHNLPDALKRAANSVEMYEKTAAVRKFIEGRFFFGSILIKIDLDKYYNQNAVPKWWEGIPVAICSNNDEALIALTFFNTYDLTMRDHVNKLAASNQVQKP